MRDLNFKPEPMTPLEHAIAFTNFLHWWEVEEMNEATVKELHQKFTEQFLPSLDGPHHGDCIKACAPCSRCHTQDLIEEAKLIASAIAHQ